MNHDAPDAAHAEATHINALRAQLLARGGIMGISHRFCPAGSYWADIVLPGYDTYATAATPLAAANAAVANFNRDHPRQQRLRVRAVTGP
jgi:hypothetical protein